MSSPACSSWESDLSILHTLHNHLQIRHIPVMKTGGDNLSSGGFSRTLYHQGGLL
jgi:hypothetical protein